jgi:hypothetical protein
MWHSGRSTRCSRGVAAMISAISGRASNIRIWLANGAACHGTSRSTYPKSRGSGAIGPYASGNSRCGGLRGGGGSIAARSARSTFRRAASSGRRIRGLPRVPAPIWSITAWNRRLMFSNRA